MVAQLVAIYQGNKRGTFEDKVNNKSIDFQHIKVCCADDTVETFDDLILSVPNSLDTSVFEKGKVYVFNIVLPSIQKDNAKLRCLGIIPFEVDNGK